MEHTSCIKQVMGKDEFENRLIKEFGKLEVNIRCNVTKDIVNNNTLNTLMSLIEANELEALKNMKVDNIKNTTFTNITHHNYFFTTQNAEITLIFTEIGVKQDSEEIFYCLISGSKLLKISGRGYSITHKFMDKSASIENILDMLSWIISSELLNLTKDELNKFSVSYPVSLPSAEEQIETIERLENQPPQEPSQEIDIVIKRLNGSLLENIDNFQLLTSNGNSSGVFKTSFIGNASKDYKIVSMMMLDKGHVLTSKIRNKFVLFANIKNIIEKYTECLYAEELKTDIFIWASEGYYTKIIPNNDILKTLGLCGLEQDINFALDGEDVFEHLILKLLFISGEDKDTVLKKISENIPNGLCEMADIKLLKEENNLRHTHEKEDSRGLHRIKVRSGKDVVSIIFSRESRDIKFPNYLIKKLPKKNVKGKFYIPDLEDNINREVVTFYAPETLHFCGEESVFSIDTGIKIPKAVDKDGKDTKKHGRIILDKALIRSGLEMSPHIVIFGANDTVKLKIARNKSSISAECIIYEGDPLCHMKLDFSPEKSI